MFYIHGHRGCDLLHEHGIKKLINHSILQYTTYKVMETRQVIKKFTTKH